MRKALLAGAAAVIGLAVPAHATGELLAQIEARKFVLHARTLEWVNLVNIDVDVYVNSDKSSEATAFLNQENFGNFSAGKSRSGDTLSGSGNRNNGGLSINQSSGDLNNQGTLVAIAISDGLAYGHHGHDKDQGFADAQAAAEQNNFANLPFAGINDYRAPWIYASLNYNTGIVHANQSAGSMNNQANVLALAIADAEHGGVALAEADLGQYNAHNIAFENGTHSCGCADALRSSASISGSANGNRGIVGVNQSAGVFGNQANIVSIAAVGQF